MRFLLWAFALLVTSGAFAQDATRKIFEDAQKRDLANWKGVAFNCMLNPNDRTAQSLCEWTEQRLRLLGSQLRFPVALISSREPFTIGLELSSRYPDHLELLLDVFMTKSDQPPVGFHVQLSARRHYSAAINSGATAPSPRAVPRSGDLVVWSRAFVGASYTRGAELDSQLRSNLETHLMKFAADYADAQKPSAE